METTQLLLTIVLTVSTILAVVIGTQLVLVLIELRKVLKKANTIIEGFESVGSGLEHGLAEIVGFFGGFKTLLKIINTFTHKKDEKKS